MRIGKLLTAFKFENQRGDYHTKDHRGIQGRPFGASKFWPHYQCKNSCGYHVPEDSPINRCVKCHAPLVRWMRYEVKDGSRANTALPPEKP